MAIKTYSKEAVRIAAEARAEHAELKRQGYSREDALADLEGFQRELSRQQSDDSRVRASSTND